MSSLRLLLAPAVALLLLAGCGTMEASGERTSSNRISPEEIAETSARDLYELIDRLRPRWLMVRGGPTTFHGEGGILVYQGQSRLGGIEVLRQLRPDEVRWIEYLDGATASASLPGAGAVHVSGAIVLHVR